MLHLPEALPDETLYSLLARIAHVNGCDDHLDIFVMLFGQKRPASIVRTADGLDRFCDATNGVYGTLEKILQKFTHYPLEVHLNVAVSKDNLPGSGKSIWLNGGCYDYSGNPSRVWRECPQCRRGDEVKLGFSYWRRSHQLPTSVCCPVHGDILVLKNLPGQMLHERFWLPHEVESYVENDDITIHEGAGKALAEIGRDGLQDRSLPHDSAVIMSTFLEMLRQKGCLARSGKLKLKECMESFCASTGLGHDKSIWVHEFKRLLRGVIGIDHKMARQNYVLLIYWLFGSWQHFKECCKWQSVMDAGVHYPSGLTGNELAGVGDHNLLVLHHRGICLEFMKSNPDAGRGDFLKGRYKSFRWLLHQDRAWLGKQFPLRVKNNQQADLFDTF